MCMCIYTDRSSKHTRTHILSCVYVYICKYSYLGFGLDLAVDTFLFTIYYSLLSYSNYSMYIPA